MKKVLLTAAAVLSLTFVNAQDLKSKKGEAYLPVAGDWAVSFNADGIFKYAGNAFNGNTNNAAPSVTFVTNNAFVGKKFISDKMAYRVVANLGFGASNDKIPNTVTGITQETKASGFDLTAGLGKEWRKGSTRLQGFYGADALINLSSTSKETINTTSSTEAFLNSEKNKSGIGFGLGVQGFLGAEYFIFPKFAIGAQYTYRVGFDIQGKTENTKKTGSAAEVSTKGGNTSDFGFGNVGITSINLTLHF
ncbi:hypothetical protein [Flavobacterium sp.]|uniref:hypothetical protein n=1 Tax=Flavobacterium sp. TaxID=239 RepID=UPI00333F3B13